MTLDVSFEKSPWPKLRQKRETQTQTGEGCVEVF